MVNRIQVVITGANGFVAKNLRKYLSKNNIDLISISRSDFKEYKNESKIIFQSFHQIKFKNKIIDLVGPDYLTFEQYVKLFSKGTKTKIQKIMMKKLF